MCNPSHVVTFNASMRTLLVICGLAFAVNAQSAELKWRIAISPSNGGQVTWATSDPAKSGVLSSSGTLTVNQGAYVDLTFTPKDGYRLASVLKNLDDWTDYLDSNKHYQFGPVQNPHAISARFELITPTGAYDFSTPPTLPEGVAAIFNGTGHYSGIVPADLPIVANKAFDADVAMDESGKLDIMPNSLEGYTPDAGDNGSLVGVLKTQNDKPQVTVSAKFKGEFEGEHGEGSGVGTLSNIETVPESTMKASEQVLDSSGNGAYSVKLKSNDSGDKASYKEKSVAVSTPVTTDVTRDWSLNVVIFQEPSAKGKSITYARGTLTLPTGDQIAFPKRAIKYSKTKGYKINFTLGTNLASNTVDKKTKLTITNMLFDCNGSACELNDGQIAYAFLGQKGKAKLSDFVGD